MNGVRSRLRRTLEPVLARFPRRTRAGDRLILAYHNIRPAGTRPFGDRSLHLALDHFEAQLRVIRQEADIVPLMELLNTHAAQSRRVAITFDDAYASAVTIGVRACVDAGAPCTIFVTPGLLGTIPIWDRRGDANTWTERDRTAFLWEHGGIDTAISSSHATPSAARIATHEELVIAAQHPGVSLGAHTMTHPNLGVLTAEAARRELGDSWEWVRERFPRQAVPVAAYPFGIAPGDAAAVCAASGLSFGALVSGGWMRVRPAAHAVPRWNVPAGISRNGFLLRLRGRLIG
jgi:peptidoglycan/xylan/chitin deacetylase (PgdA/CDA1 family)